MRRLLLNLLAAAMIAACGGGYALADNHHGPRGGHRMEQSYSHGNKHKKGNSKARPGAGKIKVKAPKKHHVHGHGLPPRLNGMVAQITRGCRDVNVWQINPNTYIVKYRKGNKFYTQYVYPYDYRYGPQQLISTGWQPQSIWTLIPPVTLNINL